MDANSTYLIIVLLIALNLVLVGLIVLILRTARAERISGPPGPPGQMGMRGEDGRDLFRDSIQMGIIHEQADYETWLRNLNTVILNQMSLERPGSLETGMGDIAGPRG